MNQKEIENYFFKVCFQKDFVLSDPNHEIYRELVQNNFKSVIKTALPSLHKILTKKEIENILADFLENQKITSLIYRHIPRFFVDYLKKTKWEARTRPYLLELADYELLSFNLVFKENNEPTQVTPVNNKPLEESFFGLNPHAALRFYDYPVHELENNPGLKIEKRQTWLIVCRNPDTGKIRDLFLDEQGFILGEIFFQNQNKKLGEILEMFIKKYDKPPEGTIPVFLGIITKFIQNKIILFLF